MKKLIHCRFTLVELLIVIAIIGVLAALGFGIYSVAQNKSRISATRSLVENVANAFESAKSEVGFAPQEKAWAELHFAEVTIGSETYFTLSCSGKKYEKFQQAFAKYIDAEMIRKYLDGNKLIDAWGNPIYYCYPGIANQAQCCVISAGPDEGFGKSKKEQVTEVNAVTEFKTGSEWVCDDIGNF